MIREFDAGDPEALFEEPVKVKAAKIRLNKMNPGEALPVLIKILIPAVAGVFLLWFGLTSAGSYYESSSRFGGLLYGLIYGQQLGTLMAIIGGILVYDSIKRTGYL